MIEGLITLASFGSFGGGAIGELFAQWEAQGIFEYLLPFLLIFALVFGLLMRLNIFATSHGNEVNQNKGINAIIALAVSLLALQFNVVSLFFAEIFPRMGIALAIILILLILGGLFIPTNKKNNWFMVVLVILVFGIVITVVYSSMNAMGWGFFSSGGFSFFWRQYGALIIFLAIVIAVVATTSIKPNKDRPEVENVLSRILGGSSS
ncbi:MAG TPA: hypothetical protein PK357_00090 [Candidatus Pacearchaeota archaeon]|nr:hypothetical protein [Candidatus Pacearchaeota archaeon]